MGCVLFISIVQFSRIKFAFAATGFILPNPNLIVKHFLSFFRFFSVLLLRLSFQRDLFYHFRLLLSMFFLSNTSYESLLDILNLSRRCSATVIYYTHLDCFVNTIFYFLPQFITKAKGSSFCHRKSRLSAAIYLHFPVFFWLLLFPASLPAFPVSMLYSCANSVLFIPFFPFLFIFFSVLLSISMTSHWIQSERVSLAVIVWHPLTLLYTLSFIFLQLIFHQRIL